MKASIIKGKSGFRPWLEPLFFVSALILLFFMEPEEPGLSLCVFHHLGWESCPGCGLGTAIHYLLHGAWRASWEAHVLAAPAVGLFLFRTFRLLSKTKI